MSKKVKITIYVLLAVLVVSIAAAAVIILVFNNTDGDGHLASAVNPSIDAENKELTIEQLREAKRSLEAEVAELNAKLSDSGKTFSDEIDALKAEIEAKNAQIVSLEADIAKYREVFNIDVLAQAKLIDEIVDYLENDCPYVKQKVIVTPENESSFKKTDIITPEDGEKYVLEWRLVSDLMAEEAEKATPEAPLFTPEELSESGLGEDEFTNQVLHRLVLAREDVVYPEISIYYEDLATGYHFAYNADKIYDPASVVKAPYIMSVLETISADEKAYLDKLAEEKIFPEMIDDDGDGEGDRIKYEYSKPEYDLYEKVIYDKATMFKSGSGKIQTMEDGTEFNYIDFIKYTLEYSDNIGYSQLRSRYGYDTMTALAKRLGVRISGGMSAKTAGKLFGAIYNFIETDDTYGNIMEESMLKANHTVIIPYGVSPAKVLHKYGWDEDSYHDAGIVLYSDKPYVLAVFSDLDKGGDEINAYLRGAVRMIQKLHTGFYNN